MGPLPGFHLFTWQGELHISAGYSESVVGTWEEQIDAMKNDEKATGSLLSWFITFIGTLERASGVETKHDGWKSCLPI